VRPRAGAIIAALIAFLVLVPLVALPQLEVLRESLRGGTTAAWSRVFDASRPAPLLALFNSIWVSLASVLGAGVLGTALALLVSRVAFPLRGALAALAVLPLLLPPIVGVLTFKQFLFGEYGIVAGLLRRHFGVDWYLDGFAGVIALHVYAFFPFFFLFVAAGQKRLDPALTEAAISLGASRAATLRRVILPLLVPAICGAAVLVLLNSMGSFSAPLFFAPDEEFLTLRIYNRREDSPAEVAALSSLLAVVCLLLLLPLRSLEARSTAASASKGRVAPLKPPFGPFGRGLLGAFAALLVVALLLPHLSIVVLSFAADGGASDSLLPSELTLAHWQRVLSDDAFLRPMRASLWMASIAAAVDLLLGLYLASVVAARRVPFKGLLEILALLPMALPATVVAFNVLRTFGPASPLTFGNALAGTVWLLPLAYTIRHLPIAYRATKSALATLDPSLVDAAVGLGASRLATLRRVAFPIVSPAILSGALLCLLSGLTEFVASILLYVPANLPIAVEIFNRQYNRALGEPAALSVLLLVAQASILLIANRALRLERADLGR
jgi:iron(III) transport system permease protein